MLEKGKFIVLEGVGGAGKSTHMSKLAKYISSHGLSVVTVREPGGVPAAEGLRELTFYLEGEGAIDNSQAMVLFFAARWFLLKELIIPSLNEGKCVLCDRFDSSTMVYQGGGMIQENYGMVETLSRLIVGNCVPDLTVLLDVTAETAIRRKRGLEDGDPFDKRDINHFETWTGAYRSLAKEQWGARKWVVVDGEMSVDEVQGELRRALGECLGFSGPKGTA